MFFYVDPVICPAWLNHDDRHPRKLSLRSSSDATGSRLLPNCLRDTQNDQCWQVSHHCALLSLSPLSSCLMLWQCKLHQSLHWGGHTPGHSSDTQRNTLSACSQRNTDSVLTACVLCLSHADTHTAQHHMLTSLTHEVLWPRREINYTLILLCTHWHTSPKDRCLLGMIFKQQFQQDFSHPSFALMMAKARWTLTMMCF